MSKYWVRAMMMAAMLCAGSGWAQERATQAVAADRIVAVVNDEVITYRELTLRQAVVERQIRQQGTPMPDRRVLEVQVLDRMVNDKVQLQLARMSGVNVDDETLEAALTRIASGNKMTLSTFRNALEKDGVAWKQFREEIRSEITMARLKEREVDSRVVVSEAEVDNQLAEHGGELGGRGNEYFLAHILLRAPENARPEQMQKLQAKADEVVAQLKRGKDFGQLAASYSDAPDALNGGSLGWRSADRLPGVFADAAASMQPGQVSGVLRSPAGLHIIKMFDRRGGKAAKTDAVQQTRVRHILIKTSTVVSDEDARRRLVGLKERLDNGGNFAELARVNSQDLSSAKGGDLGWVYQGDTVPEFEKAMDALQPGQVSVPIRSPFGWHLIQVLERRTADVSEDRRRLLARQAVRDRKAEDAYQDWVRQQRDRAYVEVRLEDR